MVIYPLVNIQKAMENGPVEIVDFPMNSMVDLSMAKCKRSPEGIWEVQPEICEIHNCLVNEQLDPGRYR